MYHVALFFFNKFLLACSCFTMLCQFLLCNNLYQLYVYIYPLFFRFPSHLGHRRALSRVPCPMQQLSISFLSYTQQCICVNPDPIHPTPASCLGNPKFVLYIRDSISALQISSLVPFFSIPHISNVIQYFSHFQSFLK